MNNLFTTIASIPPDKTLHFSMGSIGGAGSYIACDLVSDTCKFAPVIGSFVLGFTKELIDKNFSFSDLAFTLSGGFVVQLPIL